MKITIKKAQQILVIASTITSDVKFTYAVKKLSNKLSDRFEKFNEDLEDARIEYCSLDDKGNVLKNEKDGYVFSRENMRLVIKKMRSLVNSEIEFDPYYSTSIPSDITEDQIELFTGILIAPNQQEDGLE